MFVIDVSMDSKTSRIELLLLRLPKTLMKCTVKNYLQLVLQIVLTYALSRFFMRHSMVTVTFLLQRMEVGEPVKANQSLYMSRYQSTKEDWALKVMMH
jgi:hypothetical protein